jgi:hypothetical protein
MVGRQAKLLPYGYMRLRIHFGRWKGRPQLASLPRYGWKQEPISYSVLKSIACT